MTKPPPLTSPTPASVEQLFERRVADDPAGPLVTFYDDATGERAELSAKSLGNWVAKTHFLLMDGIGLGVGDRAFVSLPVHWLAAPILLGCWFAGLHVTTSPDGAAVAFGDAESLLGADCAAADDLFAVSLLSMARSAEPPPGMADYAASVRPQPDNWPSVRAQARPTDPALDGLSRAELAQAGSGAATELGLGPRGRLLWSGEWAPPRDWIAALVAPIVVGGSVVLVRNADPDALADRARSENVTARA